MQLTHALILSLHSGTSGALVSVPLPTHLRTLAYCSSGLVSGLAALPEIMYPHRTLSNSRVPPCGAAAEQFLLSQTDFQIVSQASTFGRTAGFQSMRAPDSMYTVQLPYANPRRCGPGDHDTMADLTRIGIHGGVWYMGI